jgi:hypothetical protein
MYAVKYFYEYNGVLFTPVVNMQVELNKWYGIEGRLSMRHNGFHFPSYLDIFLGNLDTWYNTYKLAANILNYQLKTYLIEIGNIVISSVDIYVTNRVRVVRDLEIVNLQDLCDKLIELSKDNSEIKLIYGNNINRHIKNELPSI